MRTAERTTALPFESASPLAERYRAVRRATEALTAPLAAEDYVVQSMPDASPVKWHLAHTTWFFETFVLAAADPGHRAHDPAYGFLFNSYYEGVGERFERTRRGILSRPTVEEVFAYRSAIDSQMLELLARGPRDDVASAIVLGLHHEQQHQELILTDIKNAFASNPMRPAYDSITDAKREAVPSPLSWEAYPEAVTSIGSDGGDFAFDNETPRHRVLVGEFALASRLVTSGEYLEFMRDRGYARPDLWLSDGAAWVNALGGMRDVDLAAPVCHVSFYEADAYARWACARLPTEHEWEWTGSAYAPYPRFRPLPGALGEYNGKFMCNQMVLRGGSCATPEGHIRASYRNFFPPEARWQFTGIRLARS